MSRPFIKWAGGKTQLLKHMHTYFPKSFNTYYEPFVGGGAVFFCIRPEKAVLSDANGELINAYEVIKTDVEPLIQRLSEYVNEKEFYLNVRSKNPMELERVDRAARFIFLNKTGFNGLYRVNKRNEFNVPFGGYKNPTFCDKGNLRSVSKLLQNVEFHATYFEKVLVNCQEDDFVYLDPPYLPIDGKNFTSYTKKGFSLEDHERLASLYEELTEKNVKVLQSNSDTEWARDRYKEFETIEVQGRRSINSKGDGRGKVGELLIKNY